MGRYVYDANLVNQAISELNSAVSVLSDVTTEIQAGINTIKSATGSKFIDADYSLLLKLQENAEEVIEEDIRTIQSKVSAIEEYESAPWIKKIFSSIGMGLTKFVEGIAAGIEDLDDGIVSITGFFGGIFKSEKFKNSCAEYVAKDHVGDWFAKQYEEGFLSNMNKYSYFAHTSTAANVFKAFGTAAPYIALSMTGVGLGVETLAAGISGIGSGTEAGIQKALATNPEMTAGEAFNSAFAEGLWQGTKNAALVFGLGKISQGIHGRNGQLVKGSADDFIKLTGTNADDVAVTAKKILGSADNLTAIPLDDGYRLVKAGSSFGDDVGKITFNGDNVIFTSFDDVAGAAKNYNAATRIISESGDEVLINTAGTIAPGAGVEQLVGKSFDDIAKTTVAGKATKVFKKAGEIGEKTKINKVLQTGDDLLAKTGNKITSAGKKVTNAIKNNSGIQKITTKGGQLLDDVASSKIGGKITTKANKILNGKIVTTGKNIISSGAKLVGNTVAKHPVAAFTATSALLTAEQIDEQVVGTAYREVQKDDFITQRTPEEFETPVRIPDDKIGQIENKPVDENQNTNNSNGNTNSGGGFVIGDNTISDGNSSNNNFGVNSPENNEIKDPITVDPPVVEDNNSNIEPTPDVDPVPEPDVNNPPENDVVPDEQPTPDEIPGDDTTPGGELDDIVGGDIIDEDITPDTGTSDNNPSGGNTGGHTNGNSTGSGNNGGHTGGYNGGYIGGSSTGGAGYNSDGYQSETTPPEDIELPVGDTISDSFAEIIGDNEQVNIPTSGTPITATTTTGQKKSIIPVIAGLSAAAVAGVGTKAYLDKKENSEFEEENIAEEWKEEDSLDIDYEEAMEEDGDYLNPSDEYAYQEENVEGSYEAVNSSELASMQ